MLVLEIILLYTLGPCVKPCGSFVYHVYLYMYFLDVACVFAFIYCYVFMYLFTYLFY